MEAPDQESPESESRPVNCEECTVTAHGSSPERVVFTEEGNTDAWISTNLTVSLHR